MAATNGINGNGPKLWGLLAQYDTPQTIYPAAERVRDAGYTKWDTCTPFAVHGLDKAMGVRPTVLPWFVFFIGIVGSLFAICFECWVEAYAMPIVVGGKPLFSIPAFVPVWYEFTVLTSCFTAFFGTGSLNGLPRLHHPAFNSRAFERVTDDKFFVLIEAKDPKFDLAKTTALLKDTGAVLVEELED